MTDPRNHTDLSEDLEPGTPLELVLLAERLQDSRPLPNPGFRGELGRRLERTSRRFDPARLRSLIAIYGVSGTALMIVGAVSAAGAGPLG